MTAALIVSLILNIALLVTAVCVTVLFSRALQTAVSLTDRVHTKSTKQIESLCDRLMAVDYTQFHTMREERETEEGGQILPTDETPDEDGEFLLTQLSEDELRQMANERQLLAEDFPDADR